MDSNSPPEGVAIQSPWQAPEFSGSMCSLSRISGMGLLAVCTLPFYARRSEVVYQTTGFWPGFPLGGSVTQPCPQGLLYQAASWKTARRVVAKVKFHFVELFPRVGRRETECNSQDQRKAAGCILNSTRESKLEIPANAQFQGLGLGCQEEVKLSAFSTLVLILLLLAVGARAGTIIFGTAGTYAVIAQTLVSNATTFGDTVITGSVGISPSGSCTGFAPVACGSATAGTISGAINMNNGAAATALGDAETLEGALLTTVIPAPTNLTGHVLGSSGYTSLAPGVYTFTSGAQLTGALTLAAGGNLAPLWIFETTSTLTTSSGASVTVTDTTGGAGIAAAGVYWVVGSQATLGDSTAFLGNILAETNITFDPGAQDTCGRAFADTSVTSAGDNQIGRAHV